MVSRVFLDANVLLDFTLKREHYQTSKKIFELAVDGKIEAFISPTIVHISAYWLAKSYGNAKTKELILTLMEDVRVIDADHEITLDALYSGMDDIEDALQCFTAIHHKMDYLLTRDKLFIREARVSLQICTPEEFLKEISI